MRNLSWQQCVTIWSWFFAFENRLLPHGTVQKSKWSAIHSIEWQIIVYIFNSIRSEKLHTKNSNTEMPEWQPQLCATCRYAGKADLDASGIFLLVQVFHIARVRKWPCDYIGQFTWFTWYAFVLQYTGRHNINFRDACHSVEWYFWRFNCILHQKGNVHF